MIKKLSKEVVEKIAAGEVITSPASMVKEMIENSLDAGSSSIEVRLRSDYSSIEVIDNGCGIDEQDFKLLCERHCTSKLSIFEDLRSVRLYGFRGEALASISLCSRVTARSNKVQGFEGRYVEGRLASMNKVGMNKGTHIIVADLFYNNSIRKGYFTKSRSEIRNILNLVLIYSVFNNTTRFSVYLDDTLQERFAYRPPEGCISERELEDKKELLQHLYGIKNELISYCSGKFRAIFSNFSLHLKKPVFVLFVNKRLVESRSMKDELVKVYSNIIPKQRYPFIYIELELSPEEIDVNIHPSKKEVLFDEMRAILEIKEAITSSLETQNTITIPLSQINCSLPGMSLNSSKNVNTTGSCESQSNPKIYSSPFDARLDNLKSYGKAKEYRLESIKELSKEIECVDGDFFKLLVYVGRVDNKVFVQYGAYLLVCDFLELRKAFFYQNFVVEFGNFDRKEVGCEEICRHRDHELEDVVSGLESNMRGFLDDYFCIRVLGTRVTSLPTKYGIEVDMQEWRSFLASVSRIALDDEAKVFRTVIEHLASIFAKACDDERLFHIIKRKAVGTVQAVGCFSVITTLKTLYRQFERC